MSWLLPIGFVGLVGLAVLLLIYLIRPNYQQKLVSSTFVWKLSLKYQKKRLPISKIKNLIILLMQILILTLCAFILAGPVVYEAADVHDEVVIIIDASASMRAHDQDNVTRFDRAVEEARELAAKTFDSNGRVTVIFAGKDSEYIMHRATRDSSEDLDEELLKLVDDGACTYGSADIDGALKLANDVVRSVPETKVVLYTSTKYKNHGNVDVRTMTDDADDWNVAVLDMRAEKSVENIYTFYVDLACYGRDVEVTLGLNINKVNNKNEQLVYSLSSNPLNGERIRLVGNRVTTVTVQTDKAVPDGKTAATPVFEFDDVTASVQVDDSLSDDNTFSLFGNTKPVMNIQYASSRPNSFFAAAFMSLQNALKNRWTVNFREIRDVAGIATSGYDLYVFEDGAIPDVLPTDGVVFFVNPTYVPRGVEFSLSAATSTDRIPLTAGAEHPITKNIYPGNIELTRHAPILLENTDAASGGYTALMYCQGNPVLACKNTVTSKIVIMSFSVNYSTAPMSYDFPRLIMNIVNYYMPSTFVKSVYEANEVITLNSRGATLQVTGPGLNAEYKSFPQSLELTRIGTYTTTQKPISGKTVTDKFFVRIPAYESNIVREEAVLENQAEPTRRQQRTDDLCVYFAAVLVVLLVVERLLQSRTMS